jgi:hypothetical protein
MQEEKQSVIGAPQKKEDACFVPQSEQNHGNQQTEISPPRFTAQAHQREEDVVANPERERHVPARPEDRRAGRLKRPREILGDGEAERLGCTDGDVRVPGEVEEELQAVAEREAPDVRPLQLAT